jgi:hypothetical protein
VILGIVSSSKYYQTLPGGPLDEELPRHGVDPRSWTLRLSVFYPCLGGKDKEIQLPLAVSRPNATLICNLNSQHAIVTEKPVAWKQHKSSPFSPENVVILPVGKTSFAVLSNAFTFLACIVRRHREESNQGG